MQFLRQNPNDGEYKSPQPEIIKTQNSFIKHFNYTGQGHGVNGDTQMRTDRV